MLAQPRLMPRFALLLAGCVALMAFAVACQAVAAEVPAKPNIVFILADDLGYSDVGFHKSEIRTPHLDKLAAEGMRLEQFYVQPVCSPTRGALMTGRYPIRLGLQVDVIWPWITDGLPADERILAQALHEAGYYTAITGKWHLGEHEVKYVPTRRGFDHQYGHYLGAIDYWTHMRDGGLDWHRNDKPLVEEGYSTELLGNEAAKIIEQHDAAKPLFLYVPFNASHTPLQAPDAYLEQYSDIADNKRRTYAAMTTAMDDAIGRIVAALDKQGLREKTLIVFSSDNGGPTGSGATNGPYRAGKTTLYEGGVRVTALANWRGVLAAGSVCSEPMHMVDWYPTLLKLAGASLTQSKPLDGFDIWPVLTAGAKSPHEEILHNVNSNSGAIRRGDWKLVVHRASPTTAKKANKKKAGKKAAAARTDLVELFNIADDPYEKNNLAESKPEVVAELQAILDRYAAEAVAPINDKPQPAVWKAPKIYGPAELNAGA